jgi:hypothetical protein
MRKAQWTLLWGIMLFVIAVGGCGGGGGGDGNDNISTPTPSTSISFNDFNGVWSARDGTGTASGYGDTFQVRLRDSVAAEFELIKETNNEATFVAVMDTNWDVYYNGEYQDTMPLGTNGVTQALVTRIGNSSFQYITGLGTKIEITFLTKTSVRLDVDGVYQVVWASGRIDEYDLAATYYMDKVR